MNQKRILIVEDEIESCLTNFGYKVAGIVNSGEKSIRSKFSFPFGFLTKPFNDNELKLEIDKY